jgi:hypothetical protein
MLTTINLLHTLVRGILAGSIVVLPIAGMLRRFRWAAILTGLVLLECIVLAANGGRCPLSDLAQQFTANHTDNFDIYLPNWLAQYNKVIFGMLFVAGESVVLGCWFRERSANTSRQFHRDSHIEFRIILLHFLRPRTSPGISRPPMRSASARLRHFGLEGYIQASAIRQCCGATINVGEIVLNPNFSKQVFRLAY